MFKSYSPVTLSRTGSTYIAGHNNIVSGGKITNPSYLRHELETEMYLQRTWAQRNEHKTGKKTVCYRMSNEHKPKVERMKRTNNECLPDTTNIKRKNNEQTTNMYRTIRTHIGHLPHMCIRRTPFQVY